jgi:transposase InsO family protein
MSDAGSVFNAQEFRDICFEHGITLKLSGIECHNSIGVCERYHHPLRQVYTKLRGEYPTMDHVEAKNEKILTLKLTAQVGLHFPNLDYDTLRLVTYADGSFANREGKSSQIGYASCLVDKDGPCAFCRIARVRRVESVDQ